MRALVPTYPWVALYAIQAVLYFGGAVFLIINDPWPGYLVQMLLFAVAIVCINYVLLVSSYETPRFRNWVSHNEGFRFATPKATQQDMIAWCEANCRGRWYVARHNIGFSRQEDAALFKMFFDAEEVHFVAH